MALAFFEHVPTEARIQFDRRRVVNEKVRAEEAGALSGISANSPVSAHISGRSSRSIYHSKISFRSCFMIKNYWGYTACIYPVSSGIESTRHITQGAGKDAPVNGFRLTQAVSDGSHDVDEYCGAVYGHSLHHQDKTWRERSARVDVATTCRYQRTPTLLG